MKQIFIHITILILSCYFLIAGLGFNVINYCCNTCEAHGIVEVASNSCGELHHAETDCCESSEHHHESDSTNDLTCTNLTHHPNSCHLLRVNVETPTIVVAIVEKIQLKGVNLLLPVLFEILTISDSTESKFFTAYSPPDTPLKAGRSILTAKSVLII